MKIQLKINDKNGAYYVVSAYEITEGANIHIGIYRGRIDEIIKKIGEERGGEIELERSSFDGWY